MAVTFMRRSGGSRIIIVPAAVADSALAHGFALDGPIDVRFDEASNAIVLAERRLRYTLSELLSRCDPTAPTTSEDRAWLDGGPVGREEI